MSSSTLDGRRRVDALAHLPPPHPNDLPSHPTAPLTPTPKRIPYLISHPPTLKQTDTRYNVTPTPHTQTNPPIPYIYDTHPPTHPPPQLKSAPVGVMPQHLLPQRADDPGLLGGAEPVADDHHGGGRRVLLCFGWVAVGGLLWALSSRWWYGMTRSSPISKAEAASSGGRHRPAPFSTEHIHTHKYMHKTHLV